MEGTDNTDEHGEKPCSSVFSVSYIASLLQTRATKKARSNVWTGPQVARKDQVILTRFWWLAARATRRQPNRRHLGWYRHNSLDHLLPTKISPVQPYAVERLTAGP